MDSSSRQNPGSSMDDYDSSESGAAPHLTCQICRRKFSRPEHLKRHGQVHAQSKPYKCRHCNKAFARKDAAKRHQNVHQYAASPRSEVAGAQTTRASPKTRRVCSACSENQNRCSGSTPCNYCASQNLECFYSSEQEDRNPLAQQEETRHAVAFASVADSIPDRASILVGVRNDAENDHPRRQHAADELNIEVSYLDTTHDGDSQMTENVSSASLRSDLSIFPLHTIANSVGLSSSRVPGANIQLDQHLQDSTSINWLPFDFSSIGSTASPTTDGDRHQDVTAHDETIIPHLDDHSMPYSEHARSSMLRHDRVSELIHSMRSCLPGQPSNIEEPEMLNIISGQRYHGSLYSNGAGSRMSQSDRRMLTRRPSYTHTDVSSTDAMTDEGSWISLLQKMVRSASRNSLPQFQMPSDVHLELLSKLCPPSGCILSDEYHIHKDILLSANTLQFIVQLYFDQFHKIYPFLDQSLLCISVWGWALCIAAAAIGARYLDIPELTTFGDHLCSIVHRLLLEELSFGLVEDSLPYIQARALAAVGMCHSQRRPLMNCGHSAAVLLFESCLRLRLLEEDERIGAPQHGQNLEQVWIAWRFRETRRRTGFFIWLLDSTIAFTTRQPSKIPLKHLNLTLPSADDLWNAESHQHWFEIRRRHQRCDSVASTFGIEESTRPRAQDSDEDLRMELQKPDFITEFATTIIIHMLTCRIWDISRCMDKSLIVNMPNAARASSPRTKRPRIIRYLGTVPEFSRWRNATCDSLDVLHWEALSQSASAGGLEGPIFLQLHLARLCILTPTKELLSHVRMIATPNSGLILPHELHGAPEIASACHQIITIWASKDRYKARLALIHAGAIFWHVRRYSSDAFVQPFAVFLAAITLWAFGIASSPKQAQADGGRESLSEVNVAPPTTARRMLLDQDANVNLPGTLPDDGVVRIRPVPVRRMPSFMQLDRPMDDELVQHFIRRGDEMQLYLEGVPDLCSLLGASQVLYEATLLLDQLTNIWSVSKNYSLCLTAAIQRTA